MIYVSLPFCYSVARGRDSISSTYDTFVPNQPPGLEQLIELQEKVKRGSLSMDEALERFSDWQRVQKGMDAIQQVIMWGNESAVSRPCSLGVVPSTLKVDSIIGHRYRQCDKVIHSGPTSRLQTSTTGEYKTATIGSFQSGHALA